jgi:abequosyltransferase
MENKPLLSICIPTYNRAEFLKDALDSILKQINTKNKDKVEICISDNASEDNTEELVNEYQKKSPIPIIYHKNEKNMGADYNFLKVVEIANGEYCWLLGSDDIIEESGIDIVLDEIEESRGVDIISFDRKEYSINLNLLGETECWFDKKKRNVFNYLGRDWSYMSIIVVKRSKWNVYSLKFKDRYIGTAYSFLPIILNILKEGGNVKIINKPLIGWRSGNDGFLSELKEYGRFKINLNYFKICMDIYGSKSNEYRFLRNNLLKHHSFMVGKIISLKLRGVDSFKIIKDVFPYGKNALIFWIYYIPLCMTPSFMYKIVRPAVKRIRYIKRKFYD